MTALWSWSAAQTAKAVTSGEVTAREVTEACLARVEEVEPWLNAMSERTADQALEAACAVDAARARGETLGPLAGVPITTKNNVDQAGTLNTGGVRQGKDNRCAEDSPLVANMKASGAVIVGRTNVPAFSFRWFTDTCLHGRTLNPHGSHLSPGGSSGGAGAAVASGMGAVAHGNDIGGSIRFPACANGVVGLRPTVGRVPSYTGSNGGLRVLTSQLITADGPLARTVEDCRVAVNVMARASSLDPQQVPMLQIAGGTPPPEQVGLVLGSDVGAPAPETEAALTNAAAALRDAGVRVQEIRLPHFEQAHVIWQRLVFHSIAHHFSDAIYASEDKALIHKVATALEFIQPTTSDDVPGLWAQRLQIMRAWSQMFEEWPVVLMPVSYRHGLRVDADQGDSTSLQRLFDDQSPLLATALMGNPGLSVPTGLAADGAPNGVQLIARWWDEARLLAAGRVIEDAMPPIPIASGVVDGQL